MANETLIPLVHSPTKTLQVERAFEDDGISYLTTPQACPCLCPHGTQPDGYVCNPPNTRIPPGSQKNHKLIVYPPPQQSEPRPLTNPQSIKLTTPFIRNEWRNNVVRIRIPVSCLSTPIPPEQAEQSAHPRRFLFALFSGLLTRVTHINNLRQSTHIIMRRPS